MSEVRPLREGFQTAAPAPEIEPSAFKPPSDTAPQAPLPSQLKPEAPAPEPALTEIEQIRKDIRELPDKWPVTVQLLYKPIVNADGELVNSLTFREPRAKEINQIGNPVRLLWDNEIIIEERKMTYIMGALSGILPPLLDQLDPRDWHSCALRLRKFFLPDLRGWQSP